jgi:para-nitrobenzyl esterase
MTQRETSDLLSGRQMAPVWSKLTLVLAAAVVLMTSAVPTTASAADEGDHGRGVVVATDKGLVRGTVKGQLREFLGIPYAAPPVGDLRWLPAREHMRWRDVLDATRFGSPCPQLEGLFASPSTNEDCLFLNVYTPLRDDRSERLPVMFWIHGGGLSIGAGSQYDPAPLVAHGVVVVTINYRLGALGFLAHQALAAGPSGPSGNYGLTDQQAALRWSQQNISRFGGDPRNLTIFGESAGGLSVHAQLASPLAKGLFAKAISESGAYTMVEASLSEAEAAGSQYSASVGCGGQTASCLRKVPVSTLLANQPPFYDPNIDGRVLTQSIGPALASGQFNRVPVIEGSNHDEWRLFVAVDELIAGHPLAPADYEAAIQRTFPAISASLAHRLATVDYPLSSYGGNPSIALGALGTDVAFACGAGSASRSLSAFVRTYQYEFNDPNAPLIFGIPKVSFPLGAYHGSEVEYLFKVQTATPLAADQQRLSAAMTRYWTQFAKTGSPNSRATPVWPAYTAERQRFQSLMPPTPAPTTGFAAKHHCAIWNS